MKVIPVLMAMVSAAMAAPGDPGETAVHFLEKVRAKNLNLEPGTDTALSPHTSASKRGEIARRLERMVRDLGDDPLEVGAVKLDGDLAAVLVRKIGGFDPNRMQVFPIALVKRGAEWAAAPVPASFENAGVGYAATLRQRLAALEDWMLREQVRDLAILRDQSADRMRRDIEKNLPAATLRSLDSRQAAERFLASCETRNLSGILGLLGGLAPTFPEDWPARAQAAERALGQGAAVKAPWRLLISADILRAVVHHEEDGSAALVSIACLDPAGGAPNPSRPQVRLVHLSMAKSKDGLWRIDLPESFLSPAEAPDDEPVDLLDSDLLEAFPARIGEAYPASPQPTFDALQNALVAALHEGDLSALTRLIRLDGDPALALDSCQRAAQLWWAVREPAAVRRAVPLGFTELEGKVSAAFQLFSARHPDRLDLRFLYFEKTANGWFWMPGPPAETERFFRDWVGQQAGFWRDTWQEAMLTDCPALEKLPAQGAPEEAECRVLMESWFAAIRNGDAAAALRLTARLKLPDSNAALFRNLGYELTAARSFPKASFITGIHRSEVWAAIGTRADPDGKPSFPLYPVIATPVGPRILLEVDLSASGKRSRDFLNRVAFERLAAFNQVAADELKGLFSLHEKSTPKTDSR